MRNRIFLLLLLCTPFLMSFTTGNTKVNFFTGNLKAVKERAATEGKVYFVDFTASWCMPCRWMDETTFSDQAVANYIADHYIAVKVDIDDFDGFAYKQVHNIKLLPSILFFNSKGQEIDRYEESLSPSRFMEILKKHNTAANRKKIKVSTSTKPSPAPPKPAPPVVNRPPLGKTNGSNSKPTPAPPKADPIVPNGDGLYRFRVSRQPSAGFSVQIGAFADYGNVLTEAARLEKMFGRPIIVHIATLRDKTVYKVLIGEFKTREAALQFKSLVKQKGIEAITKDLSVMG